jgi:hypothetical protein
MSHQADSLQVRAPPGLSTAGLQQQPITRYFAKKNTPQLKQPPNHLILTTTFTNITVTLRNIISIKQPIKMILTSANRVHMGLTHQQCITSYFQSSDTTNEPWEHFSTPTQVPHLSKHTKPIKSQYNRSSTQVTLINLMLDFQAPPASADGTTSESNCPGAYQPHTNLKQNMLHNILLPPWHALLQTTITIYPPHLQLLAQPSWYQKGTTSTMFC